MHDDFTAIYEWSKIFADKTELVATITKNLMLHHKKIIEGLTDVKSDFKTGLYWKSGKDAADVLDLAVGHVKKETVLADPKPA